MTAISVETRRRHWVEISIVLLLSVGASAIYSILAIIRRMLRDTPLNQQTATINRSLDEEALFDLIYQLLNIAIGLVPVALALYFLVIRPGSVVTSSGIHASLQDSSQGVSETFARIGFNFTAPMRDVRNGVLLFLAIGIPGIGLYLVGKLINITVQIVPTGLDTFWWTVPVLLLAAVKAALLEEVILFGFLFTRLRQLAWNPWTIVIVLSLLRGSYHLYQGFGMFIGNVVMGLVFGAVYAKTQRVMPLVYAHFLLDAVSFVGYPLALILFPGLF